ncbi:hypothetical protein ACJROX_02490 [Pseudalkalibacillus sp. A8]|uniref:hypothetical protein n=1 Tax=Pseudalkalibacillus sp. A8 TaxID=3382641 RepID=UPI0038B69088
MNDPKCTKKTLNRLLGLGYAEDESKKIGSVLVEEMYNIMKHQVSFDEKRYAKKLSLLPDYRLRTMMAPLLKHSLLKLHLMLVEMTMPLWNRKEI